MIKIYGAKAPYPFLKGLIRDNRPVWFMEEAGLPYERISLDPMKGETRNESYSKINAFQKVPTLEDNGFILYQSAAILNHLAESSGKLYPKDKKSQAKHLEWMFFCMSDIEPHAVQMAVLLPMTDEKDKAHAEWMLARAEKILVRGLKYLDMSLEGKKFLMGDEFLAADILLGCCLYPIHNHSVLNDLKNIKSLCERYFSRPAFKKTIEINGT